MIRRRTVGLQRISSTSSITSIIKICRLAFSASTRHTFSHAHCASLQLTLLKTGFSALFNTNKTLEPKVKTSMATSLHSAFIDHYIIIRPSESHIYSWTDAFTLLGFTTAFKATLNERNHDGFNALTETEKENGFAFILNRSCRQWCVCVCVCVCAIARAQRRAHQTRSLHSLTKHFKSLLIVYLCDEQDKPRLGSII